MFETQTAGAVGGLETPATAAPAYEATPLSPADVATQPDAGDPAQGDTQQWIELPTGQRYRTVDDLKAAQIEASRTISEYKQQQQQLQTTLEMQRVMLQQMQAQQHAAPTQSGADALAQEQARYQSMLREAGYDDPAFAGILAKDRVDMENRILQKVEAKTRQGQMAQEYESCRARFPEFDVEQNPIAREVYHRYPNRSPREHLAIFLLESAERGVLPQAGAVPAPSQPQFQPDNSLRRQQYSSVPGGGNVPAAPAEHPWVSQAVARYRNSNPAATPAQIARVREHAKSTLPMNGVE